MLQFIVILVLLILYLVVSGGDSETILLHKDDTVLLLVGGPASKLTKREYSKTEEVLLKNGRFYMEFDNIESAKMTADDLIEDGFIMGDKPGTELNAEIMVKRPKLSLRSIESNPLGKSTEIAQRNMKFNRYFDILPYDDDVTDKDYLNMSKIDYAGIKIYAGQAPKENCMETYLGFIFNNGIKHIFVLGPAKEGNTQKMYKYWDHDEDYGKFLVKEETGDELGKVQTHKLKIIEGEKSHEVHVHHIDTWPDDTGVEEVDLENLLKAAGEDISNGTAIVHCSAGIGRTGTLLVWLAGKKVGIESESDLLRVIKDLRGFRMHLVKTMGQYRSLCKMFGLKK
jgi:protein tyrosine phosphatase